MTSFLTISVGDSADTARPLLASTNPVLVRHAIRGFFGIIDRDEHGGAPLLELLASPRGDRAPYQWVERDVDFELERADVLEMASAEEPSGPYHDELIALGAWHRDRARAIALLVQQRNLKVKLAPDGVPFLADSDSDGAALSVRVSSNGVPYLAKSSESAAASEG